VGPLEPAQPLASFYRRSGMTFRQVLMLSISSIVSPSNRFHPSQAMMFEDENRRSTDANIAGIYSISSAIFERFG
jgi:hypothetical protein